MDEHQLNEAFRTSDLIVKYLQEELDEREQQELDIWIDQSPANRELFSELSNAGRLKALMGEYGKFDKKTALRKLHRKLFPAGLKAMMVTLTFWRFAAAAMFILVIGMVVWYVNSGPSATGGKMTSTNQSPGAIVPGSKKAQLVMPDGKIMDLQGVKDSSFINEDGIRITNDDGMLSYRPTEDERGMSYHTVIVQRGGEYQLTLEDGTRVWLNAASSLRYPTHFPGRERMVELTGEAYFEVAKSSKPFYVIAGQLEVEVKGTAFNMMTYAEEPRSVTTLVEGSVKVISNGNEQLLQPGKMAQVDRNGIIVKEADIEQAVSWMTGAFHLDNADIPTLMRQVERWYDIQVSYPNGVPKITLYGVVDRGKDLSELLEALAASGVKTRLEGRRLLIL
jgi:transmembrane sensor